MWVPNIPSPPPDAAYDHFLTSAILRGMVLPVWHGNQHCSRGQEPAATDAFSLTVVTLAMPAHRPPV